MLKLLLQVVCPKSQQCCYSISNGYLEPLFGAWLATSYVTDKMTH